MSLYLLVATSLCICSLAFNTDRVQRCRTTDDLGRIPWFSPNSTFHNFGYPLIRTLCDGMSPESNLFISLGCDHVNSIAFEHESVRDLRNSNRSSTIIVDPHGMENANVQSSGTYVISAMFEILHELGYHPSVRHWSDAMSEMFPADVAAAASEISHRYTAFEKGKGENPFASTLNHIMLQVEVPFGFVTSIPVNPSPYGRTFRWIIGLHHSHNNGVYKISDPTSHCAGANFHLGRARMCSNSGVVACPQYMYHRTRSLEVTPETRKLTKKNIILFDADQEEVNMEQLKADVMKLGGLDDLVVYISQGRKKSDMPDFYKTVKMTIDCHNPGVEFINYEATLYDTMTLSCDLRATRNVFDFPVPSKYHIDPKNWTQLVKLVHDSMVNYEERIDDFKHFKQVSRTSSQLARTQVDLTYFSRDIMFRTYCNSYADCRRIYPWAVALWTLYPLAMIEVVTDVDVNQEFLDNDFIRVTLSDLFTYKHIRVFRSVPGVAPVDLFPLAPCAYMVYMDASFIPFGRDFLNTHIAALVKDPRPIVYWQGDKIAIAVMHARPYLKLFTDAAGGRAIYIETKLAFHTIGNYDTYLDLLRVCNPPQAVNKNYLQTLQFGADFYQGHLQELLKKYPPLPSAPCEDSNSNATTPSGRRRTSSAAPSHIRENENHHHHHHKHNRTYPNSQHRCAPPEHLIIDAIYVPRSLAVDRNSAQSGQNPSLWLTSSITPLSFKTVFDTFNTTQIETIVQHLDPILQNANMLKIWSFIPEYIAEVLQVWSAANYPNVISLRDMEYPRWGEPCS